MNRAALYIRVSTLEQAQEGYSVGEQKERLIAYCKAKDWIIADIYVDGGYPGSNLNRPGIQKAWISSPCRRASTHRPHSARP